MWSWGRERRMRRRRRRTRKEEIRQKTKAERKNKKNMVLIRKGREKQEGKEESALLNSGKMAENIERKRKSKERKGKQRD